MHDSDKPIVYPASRTVDQVDDYHGVQVKDPYRWLEEIDSDETKAWIEAQNQVTYDYLNQIPSREQIKQRLTQLWNYEKFDIPFKAGHHYFYFENDGIQNQSVLYTLTSLDAEPRVLLDPNQLSEDGTVALTNLEVSPNGKLIAYGLSTSGSDWQEWKVRNVETGEDLSDHLEWIKSSEASWTQDSQGFFYSHYYQPDEKEKFEEPNYFQRLFYHKIGQSQSEDALIYESPTKKEWSFRGDDVKSCY